MGILKSLLRLTPFKIILASIFFLIINLTMLFCSPYEYQTLNLEGVTAPTMQYQCGGLSEAIYTFKGSYTTYNETLDWILYILTSYLLAALISKALGKK